MQILSHFTFSVGSAFLYAPNNVDFEHFGSEHPHGKYLLFKPTLSMPLQHLIPYYREIFLASSPAHCHGCSSAVLGREIFLSVHRRTWLSLSHSCFIGVSMRPHRMSDLWAPLKCFHLLCQNNLDSPVITGFPHRCVALLRISHIEKETLLPVLRPEHTYSYEPLKAGVLCLLYHLCCLSGSPETLHNCLFWGIAKSRP